jgi:hypothetical protein
MKTRGRQQRLDITQCRFAHFVPTWKGYNKAWKDSDAAPERIARHADGDRLRAVDAKQRREGGEKDAKNLIL